MHSDYLTIKKSNINTVVIEKSKFICNISPIKDESDAKSFIEKICKEHSMATHNCYAYIADDKGLVGKFSDDGEPQGTAGFPMFDVLKKRGVFKVCAVVTRYFGGIKLGTGGLTRAYSGSISECLDKSEVVTMKYSHYFYIDTDYQELPKIKKYCERNKIVITETLFSENVKLSCVVEAKSFPDFDKLVENLSSNFYSKAKIHYDKSDYYSF